MKLPLLHKNTRKVEDVLSVCTCSIADTKDAIAGGIQWHGAAVLFNADLAKKDELYHNANFYSASKMPTDTLVLPQHDITDVSQIDKRILHIEEKSSNVLNSSDRETESNITTTSAVQFSKLAGHKDPHEYGSEWKQSSNDSQNMLSYRDKQYGQTSISDLTTVNLQKWIMLSSEGNYNSDIGIDKDVISVKRQKQNVENVKFQCLLCGKSVQRLSLHMRMHTGERPYQCSQCGQRFTQLGSLKKHQTLHSDEKPFHCDICGKCFRCKSDLSLHTKLHTGKSFDCSYCSKSFVTQKAIDNHVRIHTGEKPYLCHVCGMSFSQEGNLSMHVKVHTGEKPFQCSACNKYFITRTHLEKHTRTHTGEKPYTCATCQKSFSDRGYFMRHLAVHTGEKSHVCHVCNKAFTQRISLKRHSRIHTGEKPFECIICKEAFSLKRDLKRHGEKVHTEDKALHTVTHFQHYLDLNDHSIGQHQY